MPRAQIKDEQTYRARSAITDGAGHQAAQEPADLLRQFPERLLVETAAP